MWCYASTVYAAVVLVRLSAASRCFTETAKCRIMQHHTIAKWLVFCCQKSQWNSNGVTPSRGAKCRWGTLVKIADFWQITCCNSKTVEDRWIISVKSQIGSCMHFIKCLCCWWPWMTPNHPKFYILYCLSYLHTSRSLEARVVEIFTKVSHIKCSQ